MLVCQTRSAPCTVALAGLLCLLCACAPEVPAPALSGPYPVSRPQDFMDADLAGEERAVILEVLPLLPPAQREHIVLSTPDGRIFANRKVLRANGGTVRLQALGGNAYRDPQSGETLFRPASAPLSAASVDITCATGSGTGPFYRALSESGAAGARSGTFASAVVELPATIELSFDAVNGARQYRETPYLMLGGWSATGAAVDAGLQYNPGGQNTTESGTWSVFLNTTAARTRFRRAETRRVRLTFAVRKNGAPVVLASGVREGRELTVGVLGEGRWNASGTGNVLKRVTAIAQRAGQQDLNSGAVLSAAEWHDLFLGGASGVKPWRDHAGETCAFPDSARVRVGPGSVPSEHEQISIDLRPLEADTLLSFPKRP